MPLLARAAACHGFSIVQLLVPPSIVQFVSCRLSHWNYGPDLHSSRMQGLLAAAHAAAWVVTQRLPQLYGWPPIHSLSVNDSILGDIYW